jgi:hypothetical protein
MGKSDKNATKNAITQETNRSQEQSAQGIGQEQNRIDTLMPRSDSERSDVWGNYSNQAKTGFVSDEDRARLSAASVASGGSGGGASSGSGGGGGSNISNPSYIDVFNSMTGNTGGWDPTRLSNVTGDANNLRNTRSNYGDTNKSITGLQDYAKIGGVTADDLARINRPIFEEFEKTGGYTDADKANIRDRGNRAIASTYGSLSDNMNRQRITSGNIGPGLSATNFKLARQAAQDIGSNTRDTESSIADAVRSGRMSAAQAIASNQLALQPIKANTTLSGYKAAGDLSNTREAQINAAIESAAGIDTRLQDSINNSRLSAAGGLMQDSLGRASIGAGSGAAQAALNAANERFLINERNQNMNSGNAGMLATYQAQPNELQFNQSLLNTYRNQEAGQQSALINDRVAQGHMPGLGSDIQTGLNIAGGIAGMGAGMIPGLSGYGGTRPKSVYDSGSEGW